ncbi:MAG: 3'-5' exoribonuclease [Alphaproteobacteria bacterium]|nr:3'-5' exoribonuclease [Alphaproteobacteria bacterium]
MPDVMLDLETLSTRKNAIILTIGAIKFDPLGDITQGLHDPTSIDELKERCPDHFYMKVNIESCRQLGMHADADTIKWWSTKPLEVKEEALGGIDREPIQVMLDKLYFWFSGAEAVWSNGATFDIPIISDAYNMIGRKAPWKYWNERCVRTALHLGKTEPVKPPRGQHHHPLFDCYYQTIGVQRALRNISIGGSNGSGS